MPNFQVVRGLGVSITVSHQAARFLRKSAGEICENLRETQRARGFPQIFAETFGWALYRGLASSLADNPR